jgi:hypothetical protein
METIVGWWLQGIILTNILPSGYVNHSYWKWP